MPFIEHYPISLGFSRKQAVLVPGSLVLFEAVDEYVRPYEAVLDHSRQGLHPLTVTRVDILDDDEVYIAPLVGVAPGEGAEEDDLLWLVSVPDASDESVEVRLQVSLALHIAYLRSMNSMR